MDDEATWEVQSEADHMGVSMNSGVLVSNACLGGPFVLEPQHELLICESCKTKLSEPSPKHLRMVLCFRWPYRMSGPKPKGCGT